jgi:hypothetical protein
VAKARHRKSFDVKVFLNTVDGGRSLSNYRKNRQIFSAADSVFYVQDGQVKLSVISELGKEAAAAIALCASLQKHGGWEYSWFPLHVLSPQTLVRRSRPRPRGV